MACKWPRSSVLDTTNFILTLCLSLSMESKIKYFILTIWNEATFDVNSELSILQKKQLSSNKYFTQQRNSFSFSESGQYQSISWWKFHHLNLFSPKPCRCPVSLFHSLSSTFPDSQNYFLPSDCFTVIRYNGKVKPILFFSFSGKSNAHVSNGIAV